MASTKDRRKKLFKKRKHRICISLSEEDYKELVKLAEEEFRTPSQQIMYLMDLGYDLIDQASSRSRVVIRTSHSENSDDDEENSAIGFRVDHD